MSNLVTDDILLEIAHDLELVPELCNPVIKGGDIVGWEPSFMIRALIDRLDKRGLIKREVATVYRSNTYGWCFESVDTHVCEDYMKSRKEAFQKAKSLGFEPVDDGG